MESATAQFDFEAQPDSGELSLRTGELITIVRKDVGDGWWEGVNAQGQQGLFPESYVQLMEGGVMGAPPAMPPPPLPDEWGAPPALPDNVVPSPSTGGFSNSGDANGWGGAFGAEAAAPTYGTQASYATQPSSNTADADDFDWSDDEHPNEKKASVAKPVAVAPPTLAELPVSLTAPEQGSGGGAGKRGSSVRRSRDASTDDDRGLSARSRQPSSDREDSREEPTVESPSALRSFMSQDSSRSDGGGGGGSLAVPGKSAFGGSSENMERKGTVKKSLNRFSAFVKSGTEAYVLQQSRVRSEPSERHEILLSGDGAEWKPLPARGEFAVRVDKPKKESKMHGLKSFIAYQLTPASTGIQVSRRYKHFDWLLQRLTEKYAVLPVPPLPEKQVSGRYEDDFIEHRMQLLQLWVDKITRHPVLATSDVWQHFITCTDEKKWKEGKRRAEKDEFVGGNFFLSVSVPPRPVDLEGLDGRVESFARMTSALDDGVKKLSANAADSAKKISSNYKREWQKMGACLGSIAGAFEQDEAARGDPTTAALSNAAENFYKIAAAFGEQPKKDLEPLQDHLFAYKGILAAIPDVLTTQKSAVARLKEHEKLKQDGKVSQGELDGIQGRVDTISYTLQAEMHNFHLERKHDFNHMMAHYLRGQVAFYQQVLGHLQDSLARFED